MTSIRPLLDNRMREFQEALSQIRDPDWMLESTIVRELERIRPVLCFNNGALVTDINEGILHYVNSHGHFGFAFNTQTDIYSPREVASDIVPYAQIRTYHPVSKAQPELFRVLQGHVVVQIPQEELGRVDAYRPELGDFNSYNRANKDFWWTTTTLYEKKPDSI
ncbi:MAG: hypothetical protein V1729_05790 [Candidatus Woesearchaeota archaeon]